MEDSPGSTYTIEYENVIAVLWANHFKKGSD